MNDVLSSIRIAYPQLALHFNNATVDIDGSLFTIGLEPHSLAQSPHFLPLIQCEIRMYYKDAEVEFVERDQLNNSNNPLAESKRINDSADAQPSASPPTREVGASTFAANWTETPDFYFDEVLPNATPTTCKVVGAIIRNTLGKRNKHGNSNEWWKGVSYQKLMDVTGVRSRTSLAKAIWDARDVGYIKRKQRGNTFDYGLRWHDEPMDRPVEKRQNG